MTLIEQLRAALEAAQRELHTCTTALDEAHARVMNAGDADDVEALRTAFDTAGTEYDEARAELDRCRTNLTSAEERQRLADENPLPAAPSVRVVSEPLTYRAETPQRSFFRDGFLAERRFDTAARERLERHTREMHDVYQERGIEMHEPERRDVGTGAFTGLVIPQYLVDQFAPLRRAGAPLLRYFRSLPLPGEGMTVNLGRLTTGTAVAEQASENTGVQETDADDTLLTVNVRTYAGQQDLSRQAVERGQLVDVVIYEDLVRAYFTKLDSACINNDGTSGTHLGIRSTTGIVAVSYTDGSPTVAEAYPKFADAIQQIDTGIFAAPNLIVMHPRRWGWMTAALDSTSRPLVVPRANGPQNAEGVGDNVGYGIPVGDLHGLPVVTDANLPTTAGAGTEDVVLVLDTTQLFFWQEGDGMPRRFSFEQAAAPQSIRLAVWGYSAFTAGRYPLASGVISGTGLAAPSF